MGPLAIVGMAPSYTQTIAALITYNPNTTGLTLQFWCLQVVYDHSCGLVIAKFFHYTIAYYNIQCNEIPYYNTPYYGLVITTLDLQVEYLAAVPGTGARAVVASPWDAVGWNSLCAKLCSSVAIRASLKRGVTILVCV